MFNDGLVVVVVRHESSPLCGVRSQLSPGAAAASRASPRRGSEHVQAGRVALEAGSGLRRTVAPLRYQRRLSTGTEPWAFDDRSAVQR